MEKLRSNPQETINNIFSLIDANESRIAALTAVNARTTSGTNTQVEIQWADFDTQGRFLRGGVSYPQMLSSRLLQNPEQGRFASEMTELMGGKSIKIGELVASQHSEGYYWSTPLKPGPQRLFSPNGTRMVFLTAPLVGEVLHIFNPESGITPGEERITYQLLVGLTVAEAAQQDGVATETKRSQLKGAMHKLDVGRQSELTRVVTTQLLQLLHACDSFESATGIAESFVSNHLDRDVSLSVARLRNGRLIRYLEIGPRAGQEILVMHGYLFPLTFMYAHEVLEELNLKLIIPLRTGYLDAHPGSTLDEAADLTEVNLEDLILFAKERLPEGTATLGVNLGCSYAIHVFKASGGHLSKCIIANAQLMLRKTAEVDSPRAQFIEGFRSAVQNSSVFMDSLRFFKRAVLSNDFTSGQILQRLFDGCEPDAKLIEDPTEREHLSRIHREIFRTSLAGITSDVLLIDRWYTKLPEGFDREIHFIHGEAATLSDVTEVRKFADQFSHANLKVIPDVGFYFGASHPKLFWNEVKDILNCQAQ